MAGEKNLSDILREEYYNKVTIGFHKEIGNFINTVERDIKSAEHLCVI